MNLMFRYLLLAGWIGWGLASSCQAQLPAPDAIEPATPEQETQAIKEIMESERWTNLARQFDQWIALQSTYSDAEIEALRSELRNQVAMMKPAQLQHFLEEMEARLQVLLSPEAVEARRWVAPLTDQAIQRKREKYGVEDPLRVSAAQLEEALRQFAADRQAMSAGAAAFNQSRANVTNAAMRSNESQQKSLNQAATRSASSFQTQGSPYAPRQPDRNPRTFSRKYPGASYSIGPWGGVWMTPRQ